MENANPTDTDAPAKGQNRLRKGCFFKGLAGLFVLLLLLLLTAALLLPRMVNPNRYRDAIGRAVESHTGRPFQIEGDLSLRLFPWLRIEVGQMRMGNPPEFGTDPFMEIASAGAGLKVWPLLSRRIEVGQLHLNGLRANLVRNAEGRGNWEGLGGEGDTEAAPKPSEPEPPPAEPGLRMERLGGLRFSDVQIRYEDQGEGTVLEAAIPLLSVGELSPGNPFPLHLEAELALDEGDVRAAAKLDAEIQITETFSSLAVRNLALDLDVSGTGVPGGAQRATLRVAHIDADLDKQTFEVETLTLSLDDTTLNGRASIRLGELTHIRSELTLDTLDLDRYLPPPREEEPPTDDSDDPAPAEEDLPTFDELHGIDLEVSFRADRLKGGGVSVANIEVNAVIRDGVLTLDPLNADLYEGRMSGHARLDAAQSPAVFNVEQRLTGLQILPFLQDLAGFDQLTGTAQLSARLETSVSDPAHLVSGLNGDLSFDVSNGTLKGVNLWYELQRAYALARGRTAPEKTSPDTKFRQLRGSAVIGDGVLVNRDLSGGLEQLSLTGSGEVNLAASTLDYRLDVTIVRDAIDTATGERSELAGASVPLQLRGDLESPTVRVDLAGLLRDQATQELRRRLAPRGEDDESQAGDVQEQLQEGLRGLRDRLRRE